MTEPFRDAEPSAPQPPPMAWGPVPPPPGYGYPPGPPPYGYYAPPPPTNTLAILALVFAFVFAPAGIVLGILARKQIERTGEQGHGLATAGLWVGVAFTALLVLYIVFMVIMFVTIVSSFPTTSY